MAPVHHLMCERCGYPHVTKPHYLPMKTGVRAIVCAECANAIHRLFGTQGRRNSGTPRKLYPALFERMPPTG